MGSSKEGVNKIMEDKVATVFGLWPLFRTPSILLKEIGLVNNTVYTAVPAECSVCKRHKFSNLSLIGVYKKPIFYECEKCGALYLKYKQEWLENKINILKDIYINSEDWLKEPPRSDYN